jgi:hypothetical protein
MESSAIGPSISEECELGAADAAPAPAAMLSARDVSMRMTLPTISNDVRF